MPKTLVLLLADDAPLAARARHIADGVRTVRFAEVDVRRPGELASDLPTSGAAMSGAAMSGAATSGAAMPGAPALLRAGDYDAVILGVGDEPGAAAAALAAIDPARALVDRVGAAFAGTDATCWAALRALGTHGLLLVPPPDGTTATGHAPDPGTGHGVGRGTDHDADRQLGRRVATVAGWVRHARGHEHPHPPGHAH